MTRKEQIRNLWRICFDDTEEFIRFYFDKVYREEQALTIEKEGKVIAALQIIPYTMSWKGEELSVSYIYGACTLPQERGKGIMSELLERALNEMRNRQTDLTALIPANPSLFEYYRKQGYTEVFDYSFHTFHAYHETELPNDSRFTYVNEDNQKEWFPYFDHKLRERPICILHNYNDFCNIITESYLSKGMVIGLSDHLGKPAGLIFTEYNEDKGLYIKELIFEDIISKEYLLQKACLSHNTTLCRYKTPANLSDNQRLGMAMILDKEKMIKRWLALYPSQQERIDLLKSMNAQDLTQLILGYKQREAYMSLMMD